MNKSLCVASLLLATFVFASHGSTPTAVNLPVIVASGKLANQTAPINATIFTPPHTGLYRLSVYITMTKTGGSGWAYNLYWSDDAGAENTFQLSSISSGGMIILNGGSLPPSAFAYNNTVQAPGSVVPFEAIAGVPVTYTVTQNGPPDGSVYSLYYTVERLE
jgi:hypothetical protein